ncbi:4'-phosphopantetheinyl transferase family protein [Streptomyces mangrovisoli]|uniref:4'-phosphopantetheinyl transferase family protein n=1 Tax=Streptomyces mangrovisoli TaxID=1428628 RepID=UPI001160B454|nr:4'-phosphopantetheinyl transferase superfamily protein [Streptomyces mangrovisoli]
MEGPWEEVQNRFAEVGRVVVYTSWGVWAASALLDPRLGQVLGREWARYRTGASAAGRLGFVASRYLMKYTAAAVLEVPPGTVDVVHTPAGRPGVRGWDGRLALSLSHTDDLLVVAVSGTGPVGVDAERADRRLAVDLLLAQVATPAEAARLAGLGDEERRARLLRLWTLKEAYTKALGHGLRRRFSRFGLEETGGGVRGGADHGTGGGADDGPGGPARVTPEAAEDSGSAEDGVGGWEFATHLVQGRYVVSEAHRRGWAGLAACSTVVAHSLEEPPSGSAAPLPSLADPYPAEHRHRSAGGHPDCASNTRTIRPPGASHPDPDPDPEPGPDPELDPNPDLEPDPGGGGGP